MITLVIFQVSVENATTLGNHPIFLMDVALKKLVFYKTVKIPVFLSTQVIYLINKEHLLLNHWQLIVGNYVSNVHYFMAKET